MTQPLPSLPDLPAMGQTTALSGTIEEDDAPFSLPAMGTVSDFDLGDLTGSSSGLPDLPGFNMATADQNDDEDPVERLRKLIEDRREETVEILRGWMEEKA
jgi:flagellar M-ring protein FliF